MCALFNRRKWVIRSQVRLRFSFRFERKTARPDAVHRLHGGGWLRDQRSRLRYSRAPPATGCLVTKQTLSAVLHRSVGEPAEGSLNLSTTTQRTNRTRPRVRPPPGTARVLENTRSAHGSAGGGPAGRPPHPSFPRERGRECAAGHPLSNPHNPNNTTKLKRKRVCPKGRRDHKQKTTLNNGYLGSRIDEERSEMRYVV